MLRYLESLGDAGSAPVTPLSEAEATALTGIYVFGTGVTEKIEVTTKGSLLTFKRTGGDARNLIPVGDKTFHPSGASAVRIRFSMGEKGMVLTVHDPNPVMVGVRIVE